MTWVSFAIAGVVLVASLIGTDWMQRYARKAHLLDIPNERSSHQVPTPRGGGVAIVVVFLASVLVLAAARQLDWKIAAVLIGSGGLVALVGFIDDRRPLRAAGRFSAHFAAAVAAVVLVGTLPAWTLADMGVSGVVAAWAITILMLVWSTNLFNFMDGIDGLAGSEAVFVGGSAAALCWLNGERGGFFTALICLASASFGFLRWNWPPAKIFMGDVGSGFLGFVLAAFAMRICQRGVLPWETCVILIGVFLVDATVTLLRRILRGDAWTQAHRTHAYQHLARRLGAHWPVTFTVGVINVVWLLPWAWAASVRPAHAKVCLVGALLPLCLAAFVLGSGRQSHHTGTTS